MFEPKIISSVVYTMTNGKTIKAYKHDNGTIHADCKLTEEELQLIKDAL